MKIIEKLTLQDLKKAFRNYERAREVPEAQISRNWKFFWMHLERKCSIVEVIGEEEKPKAST